MLPLLPGLAPIAPSARAVGQESGVERPVEEGDSSFEKFFNKQFGEALQPQPIQAVKLIDEEKVPEIQSVDIDPLDNLEIGPNSPELLVIDLLPVKPVKDWQLFLEKPIPTEKSGELANTYSAAPVQMTPTESIQSQATLAVAAVAQDAPQVVIATPVRAQEITSKPPDPDGIVAFPRSAETGTGALSQPPKTARNDGQTAAPRSHLEEAIAKTHQKNTPDKGHPEKTLQPFDPDPSRSVVQEFRKTPATVPELGQTPKPPAIPEEKMLQQNVLKVSQQAPVAVQFGAQAAKSALTDLSAKPVSPATTASELVKAAGIPLKPESLTVETKQPIAPVVDTTEKSTVPLPTLQKADPADAAFRTESNTTLSDPPLAQAQVSQSQMTQSQQLQAPQSAEQARQVAQQLVQATPTQAPGTTEITLNPEELGRVRMSLTMLDGSMTLTIQAERPETADLMRRHIDQLAQTYRQLGFTNIAFNFEGASHDQSRSPEPHTSTDDSAVEDIVHTQADLVLQEPTEQGRLDLRI